MMTTVRLPLVLLVLVLWNFTWAEDDGMDADVDDDGTNNEDTAVSQGRIASPHQPHHFRHQHLARSRSPHWNQVMQDVKKANEHYLLIRKAALCKESRPRVIRVKDVYPDTSKEYLPRCTLLHRCSNDVGCCDHDTMHCVPKTTETVHLHFYTLHLNTNPEDGAVNVGIKQNTIESLPFVNHTECECQIINDRPRAGPANQHRSRCAECPGEFSVREYPSGGCGCDCFDRQKVCLRQKRGRENFPEADRRCVESGRCNPPDCEYGHYDVSIGRCPRKHERRHVRHSHWRFDDMD